MWDGYIGKGLLSLLAAFPKVGKSTLLWHLLRAMHNEQEFLGRATRKTNVVIFTEEASANIAQRSEEFQLQDASIHVVPIQPGLNWANLIGYAKYRVQKHDADLIILDTISRFWGLHSEDDAAEQLRAINPLFVLVRHFKLGCLIVHHTRKGRGAGGRAVRGSNALTGAVDVIMEFDKMAQYDPTTRRRIDSLSRFSDTPHTLIARINEAGEYEVNPESEFAYEARIVEMCGDGEGSSAVEIGAVIDLSERQTQRVLAQLVSRSVLVRTGTGTGQSPFRYSVAHEE